jgi:hypothetical protein
MHELTILRTFAACTTILAAAMAAVNMNARIRCRLCDLLRRVYRLDGGRVVRKHVRRWLPRAEG